MKIKTLPRPAKLPASLMALAILTLSPSANGQNKEPTPLVKSKHDNIEKKQHYFKKDLAIKGIITSFQAVKNYESSVSLIFDIQVSITNIGKKPILFFNSEEYPRFMALSLFASKEDSESGKFLAAAYSGQSYDTSAKWFDLRNKLNSTAPPADFIYSLEPNSTWVFSTVSSVDLPTEKYKSSFYPQKESWENIQQRGAVWIKVFGDSWALNLEQGATDQTKLTFAKQLRQRWSDSGYLWLDSIVSDPISLDLSSVTPQTVSYLSTVK